MIDLGDDLLRELVAEARLAPSVHNVQPSRYRLTASCLNLFGDPAAAIPVADPAGRDWRLSHGAQIEGFALALAARGLQLVEQKIHAGHTSARFDGLVPIAEFSVVSANATAVPSSSVKTRVSWRGAFKSVDAGAVRALETLQSVRDDCLIITDRSAIADIAKLADRAAIYFLRQEDHRRELLEWLRLSRRHPRYFLDGLNGEAMQMAPIEAWGAGLVLGPLFRTLDRLGLADPLLREAAKTASAAAIILFHRPKGEDPLRSGREFYKSWLAMEHVGLKGCPMSVLADWDASRNELARRFKLSSGRHIVSVFRVGVPKGSPKIKHARLAVGDLIV